MNKEVYKEYLSDYLIEKGLPTEKPFRCLNPEHEDIHPSMSFDKKRNKVHCFSCGATYDIFDCCKILEGKINTREAFDFIENKYNSLPVKKKEVKKQSALKSAESFTEYILPFCKASFLQGNNTDYFTKRGLSPETVYKFKLGYVADCDRAGEFVTIPDGNGNYTIRFLTGNKKNRYLKIGPSKVFNISAFESGKSVVITEGEFDALSVIEAGGEAVALGSTSNWKQLCDFFSSSTEVILSLDNDSEGEKTQREIAEYLQANKFPYREVNLAGEYKDCNEAFLNDRVHFVSRVQALSGEKQNVHSALYILNHLQPTHPIPTGFTKLDELLGGGLFNELYILGGVSSVGKTTFMLQIADQIAKTGKAVTFFSLEMSPEQLVAKSLSRISQNAVTSRQILKGETDALSSNVYNEYVSIAKNESIYTTKDIDFLKDDDSSVVFVDYLQMLSSGGKGSDKQNVDNTVFALKELSRTRPVVVLSSLSRIGYKEAVSMESFKESGNIEYTADVLLGLQFAGVSSQNFDINKAKKCAKRNVEVTVLKNKNGPCGNKVDFEYIPKFNSFRENF